MSVALQSGAAWWIPVVIAAAVGAGGLAGIGVAARRDGGLVPVLRRLTGLPAWCAATLLVSGWALIVALVGFVWDVAWHADVGRDEDLFTAPHTMILLGLAGITAAAVAGAVVARWEGVGSGFRMDRGRVPWSLLPLGAMGVGAVIGFPLDDLWHRTYGVDVTMWSPTHLLMIGGAALSPLAVWLVLAEADAPERAGRRVMVRVQLEVLAVAALIGLSAFQLEFDLGVPQWQALYHPVLVAMTMGIGLVAAREVLGRGGALRATLGFLAARAVIAVLIAGVFDLSTPRFPLYVGGALVVEGVYIVGGRWTPLTRVVVSGAVISTAGMAVEWWWTHAWGYQPWQPRLLASWGVVVAMGVVGALLGGALGRAVAHEPRLVPWPGVAVALTAMALLLAVPYPRHAADSRATVVATPAGPGRVNVQVALDKPSVARDADVFRVLAWQGGGTVSRPLHRVGPGVYRTRGGVPVGSTWKSLVFLEKGPVVAAAPVSFPADVEYHLPAIPVPTEPRVTPLRRASTYLTRESHSGEALPAVLSYSGLGVVAVIWYVALVGVGEVVTRRVARGVALA